jgi:2-dehydro-3-deoxygluconokinase
VTAAVSPSARDALDVAIDLAIENGATVSLDLNVRRKLWSAAEARAALRAIAARCHVVMGGLDEARLVSGDAADADGAAGAALGAERAAEGLLALGPATAVVKLGPDGALALSRDGSPVHVPAFRVAVPVDVVGAGDAFAAGYIDAVLDGRSTADALAAANACGALAISAEGDMTGLPTRAEVERLIAAAGEDAIR